ncbi:3-oxoacyl-ACP reductase family protein [Candidatus Nitronereus thalassa]|uniref:3-oxoacyl-ACP reductase FabG n=1 Tax=Candidatus Nitronereus thalassa TaxID=3020898 RepID=A0ABU3K659_9BACT|nr:3-oxoacyl-ACP reductase family protein [Candidatus Nitronereus thalassa]MDT7041842.1 3-oxoacyl-ACP reductase FabG [Candidatus Nitronereus thalassa]
MTMIEKLDGKVAFVTGGSRGIGKAISLALARGGARVAVAYQHKVEAAESVVKDIEAAGGTSCCLSVEVTNRKSIASALSRIEDTYGGVDILVNNAGINQPTDFDQILDEDWDRILSVNLKGPFICAQEALPFLKKRQHGSIINIGSVSGQYGGPRTAHYAASKAGLISLSQVIARFGAQWNIRCNTVAAGLIASDMAQSGLQAPSVQQAAEQIVLKRLGTPEEVAQAVVFLASDMSSYITAQTINVNGGLYF